jgi:hypothetical protein
MSETAEKKPHLWLETACAILMAISSLGTAWSSFEASRWSGQASGLSTQSVGLERKAGLMHIEGMQIQAVQAQMFMEYVAAHLTGNTTMARFYLDRFPPELKKAHEAWLAQKPFENPSAPPHPFVPALYEMRNARDIESTLKESSQRAETARTSGGVAERYLTNTVLLATVLFFVGITARMTSLRLRLGTFCFGVALFAFAAARVAILPVLF